MRHHIASVLGMLAGGGAAVHPRLWVVLGALLGATGVALSAVAAHALPARLDARALASVRSAVEMQIWHALALVAAGLVAADGGSRMGDWAGGAFALGVVLFSGSIYLHVLAGVRVPAVAPVGGVLLMAGWACLALAALRLP